MEAWQLALLAWEGLKLLGVLVGAGDTTKPMSIDAPSVPLTPPCFFQENANPRPVTCPAEFTGFTLPEPDDHWAVRR